MATARRDRAFSETSAATLPRPRRASKAAAVLSFLLLTFAVGAQSPAAGGAPPPTDSIDLVLLLDDSASVLQWSRDVTSYLLGPFVRDYLRLGDTVHLLTFGSSMSLDTVRTISGEADVKAVLGQLFLLYPIQRHTDFIAALDQLTAYVRDLGSSRKKLIVIVSDGVQDPPAGSLWASLDAAGVKREIDRAAASLRGLGWPLRFVMLPFGNDSAASGVDAAGTPASAGTAAPPVSTAPGSSPAVPGSVSPPPAVGSAAASSSAAQTQSSMPGALRANAASAAGSGIAAAEEAAKALDAQVTPWPPAETPATSEASGAADKGAGKQVPPPSQYGATPEGRSAASPSPRVDTAGDFGIPSISFPSDLGKRGRDFTLPLLIVNSDSKPLDLDLTSISAGGRELLVGAAKTRIAPGAKATLRPRLHLPEDIASGPVELPVTFSFADGIRTLPPDGLLRLTLVETPLSRILSSPALLAVLGLVVFFVVALGALRLLGWLPFRARKKVGLAMGRIGGMEAKPEAGELPHSTARTERKQQPQEPVSTAKPLVSTAKPHVSTSGASAADTATKPANASASASATPTPPSAPVLPPVGPAAKPSQAPIQAEVLVAARPDKPKMDSKESAEPSTFDTYSASVRKQGKILVEMRVLEQNSHIGRRNVHELQAGQARSVGGKHSDYLIFLVPMPHSVAELHFDGESCIFAPKDRRLFPQLEGPMIDCLDKDIPMLSPRAFPLTLRFTRWEDPSLKINRLLHCIEVPGIFVDGIPEAGRAEGEKASY